MNKLPQRPFEVLYPISIKPYDIDVAGIVSNITYIRWLEDMRLMILETYFSLEKIISGGLMPTLGKTEIEYRKVLTFFDKAVGRMWISSLEEKKITARAEFLVGDDVHTIATQIGFLVDSSTARSIAIPNDIRELYDDWKVLSD